MTTTTETAPINLPRIVLLNGPPRAGKDTAHEIIRNAFHSGVLQVIHEKFSMPIKRAVMQTYSIGLEDLEDSKDIPSDAFFGMTSRQVQISFSEEWLKQLHGPEVFGKLCARRMWKTWHIASQTMTIPNVTPLYVISDSGFVDEANALIGTLDKDTAESRVLLIRLHREGHNFNRDSRGYIFADDLMYDIMEHDIFADTTDELATSVLNVMTRFLLGEVLKG